MVPSGNTGQAVQQYYDYLWSQRLEQINVPQIFIDWWGLIWVAVFGLMLFFGFFLFSVTFNSVHRGSQHVYGPTSFAGQLYERVGKPALFGFYWWTVIALAGLYYLIRQIVEGQTY